jgi:hypothetical protein
VYIIVKWCVGIDELKEWEEISDPDNDRVDKPDTSFPSRCLAKNSTSGALIKKRRLRRLGGLNTILLLRISSRQMAVLSTTAQLAPCINSLIL